jgi:protein-S-isoprenylcysteine O-methyltransferase
MSIMALFHYSEFLSIAIVQPKQVSTDSFVINHSPQYTIAAVTSWVEFFIESYFFPGSSHTLYCFLNFVVGRNILLHIMTD